MKKSKEESVDTYCALLLPPYSLLDGLNVMLLYSHHSLYFFFLVRLAIEL